MQWCILVERKVRACSIVVRGIIGQQPAKVTFPEHRDMIEAFAPDRSGRGRAADAPRQKAPEAQIVLREEVMNTYNRPSRDEWAEHVRIPYIAFRTWLPG